MSAHTHKKPRVLIAMHYLELGGAETALIGLLEAWDYSRADIDLFLYSHRGELLEAIPAEANLLPEIPAYASIESPMTSAALRGQLGVVLGRLMARRDLSRFKSNTPGASSDAIFTYIGKRVTPHLPPMGEGEYDLALSFLTPHHPLLHRAKARKKVAWIHTDYSFFTLDNEAEQEMWGGFDHIISISPSVTEGFCKKFPTLRSKIIEAENILPVNLIRQRASSGTAPEFSPNDFNILSVGRFSHAKNYDNVPAIMRRVIELTPSLGNRLKWHLIGYGGDEPLIRQRIAESGMDGHVIILGKRDNPYPYIAACDLYVQPSRYEGKSIAVREAQALGRPVVITDYATASSQLEDGIDGMIVPLDNEGCAAALANLIASPGRLAELAASASSRDYSAAQPTLHLLSSLYNQRGCVKIGWNGDFQIAVPSNFDTPS